MELSTIGEQFVKQTIRDVHETERAFAECKIKMARRGSKYLLETGIVICRMLRVSLRMELDDLVAKKTDVDLFRFCQKYQRMLRELHYNIIGFLPRISEREYPPEIVRPIESTIRQFESNFALILNPYNNGTFMLTAWPDIYRQYLEQLSPYVPAKYSRKKPNLPKWFIFLSFPRVASRNPLLHSITMTHEILHLRDHIEGISAGLSSKIRISRAEFANLINSILSSRIPVPGHELMLMPRTYAEVYTQDVLESAVMQQCTDVIDRWIRELVADLLAVRSLGPAYLFAFAEHSLALGVMDVDSDDHPNSRMRLRLILNELRNLRYFRRFKDKEGLVLRLQMWNHFAKEEIRPEQSPHHTVVTSSISRSLPKIVEKIRLTTQGTEYTAEKFYKEVWPLVELLENGIPPCELVDTKVQTSSPPSLAGILNAGYMAYLGGLDSLCKFLRVSGEVGEIEARRKLDDLLLKAIESTEIWQAWPK